MYRITGDQRKPSGGELDFRITAWPLNPIEVPSVVRVKAVLSDRTIDYGNDVLPKEALPPEVALRALPNVDADDPSQLLDLINAYGPLTPLFGTDLDSLPLIVRQGLTRKARRDPDFNADSARGGAVRIRVASHHVRAIQALVSHWSAHLRGDDDGVVHAWKWLTNGLFRSNDHVDGSIGSAWDLWTTHMNAALGSTTAYVRVEDPSWKETRVG